MQKIIGLTKDYEIVVADVRYDKTGSNPGRDVGVSFDLSEIKRADATIRDAEFMEEYYEGIVDGLSADGIIGLCNEYNCPPYQLADKIVECINDEPDEVLMELLDCSLYPEMVNVDGEDYIFVASAFGQHDTRKNDEMLEIVDQALYDDIHYFWDAYHLKNIDDDLEAIELYKSIVARMDELDDEEIIAGFVRKYGL